VRDSLRSPQSPEVADTYTVQYQHMLCIHRPSALPAGWSILFRIERMTRSRSLSHLRPRHSYILIAAVKCVTSRLDLVSKTVSERSAILFLCDPAIQWPTRVV
jgi:hypothetical protein